MLDWPVIGRYLRWRHSRTLVQGALLVAAAVLVLHGLTGPQFGPANLATVVTWNHYRGLLALTLLAAGNLFCFGCPMILARDAARRISSPRWRWPRRLRSKWIALLLFAAVLFAYELFDLWALPRATAWLIVGYFVGAIVVDTLFTGATFCKYLCPVGQFNFLTSTVSPLEVRVRDENRCRTCVTFDCIKGSAASATRPAQRGCELALFQPLKVGNLDCTFCLDCVRACPHDNVAVGARLPGLELGDERRRSGIGRLQSRWDIAALATVFVCGALVNAFAMSTPVHAVENAIAGVLHSTSDAAVLGIIFAAGLGVIPATVLAVLPEPRRFALALIPIGAGIWSAHYAFHLLTAIWTIVPVTQSAVKAWSGAALAGEPMWQLTGMRPGAVFPLQLGLIVLGAFGSAAVMAQIGEPRRGARLSWLALILLLAVTAVWLMNQPMDMRGIGMAG